MEEEGFTLIELIVVIVILGLLMAFGIPRYLDVRNEAKKATAYGILGSLRSANVLLFSERLIKQKGSYSIGDIVEAAQIQGVESKEVGTECLTIVIGGSAFTFTVTPSVTTPTLEGAEVPRIYGSW